jgi:hypothetical protein
MESSAPELTAEQHQQANRSATCFERVPTDVMHASILLRLAIDELYACMRVCKQWHALCENPRLWSLLVARDFPEWAWCGPKEQSETDDADIVVLPLNEDIDGAEAVEQEEEYPDCPTRVITHEHTGTDRHVHQHAKSLYIRSLQVCPSRHLCDVYCFLTYLFSSFFSFPSFLFLSFFI